VQSEISGASPNETKMPPRVPPVTVRSERIDPLRNP
jgi:hypothetical protein